MIAGGRERSLAELEALFASARLRVDRAAPAPTGLWVFEVVADTLAG